VCLTWIFLKYPGLKTMWQLNYLLRCDRSSASEFHLHTEPAAAGQEWQKLERLRYITRPSMTEQR
jgi:hypothetical protein